MQYFIFIFSQYNNYEIGVGSTNKEGRKGGKGKRVNGTHEEKRRK
jgi:hypothetical protein